MIIHNDASFSIFFGGERHKFIPKQLRGNTDSPLVQPPFDVVKKALRLEQLCFLHQVHGDQGVAIQSHEQAAAMQPFVVDGDFLLTRVEGVGLGVATADCLPIIIYDVVHHVVANVHAGWRGSMNEVAGKTLERMRELFKTEPEHVRVFFGPSARACCFEVGEEVLDALDHFSYGAEALVSHGDATHFDLPLFNTLQLLECGVKKNAINTSYNHCTICDSSFCSYRRDKNDERQMTVVVLT